MKDTLSTDPYKGTRDFYPEDMAVQRYIFDTWAHTAELFGFERYDASVLEPSELYKSKSALNEEMVNEQTYTFTDRGDREVTLRPEMTPTVARMIAARRRELSFPVRWYSIPNLFRYERPQRGRLREHWQLNCDIFGVDDVAADVEMIALAYQVLIAFGATPEMFEVRINDRMWLRDQLSALELGEREMQAMLRLLDKRDKVNDFDAQAEEIAGKKITLDFSAPEKNVRLMKVMDGLGALGISNAVLSPSTVRGFSYYTGTIFEIFDTSPKNNRSLIGGGRYDNLTSLFSNEAVSGVGFGIGDVTMRDFLETHNLLPDALRVTAPTLTIIPMDAERNTEGERIAQTFRNAGVRTAVDIGTKKVSKKIASASGAGVAYILVLGEDELESNRFTLKTLASGKETTGTLEELIPTIQ